MALYVFSSRLWLDHLVQGALSMKRHALIKEYPGKSRDNHYRCHENLDAKTDSF